MAEQVWHIENPHPHTVKVQMGWCIEDVKIMVDGVVIWKRYVAWVSNAFEHRFEIDNVPAVIRCANMFGHKTQFLLDGELQ